MKFRQYSYGKKSIDTFLNKIKKTFGENILDWLWELEQKHPNETFYAYAQ